MTFTRINDKYTFHKRKGAFLVGRILYSLIWAVTIIAAALVSTAKGVSEDASFTIALGLSGGAWTTLHADMPCARWCLQ